MQVLDVEGSHKAFEVLERAKTSMSRVDEKETDLYRLTYAKYLFTMGKAYQMAYQPKRALEEFLKSLEIMDQLLGDHTDKVRCLNAIGDCYQDLEEPDSAIEYFRHAYDMRKELSGENHYDMPVCKSQIGAVSDRKGDYDEAIKCYKSAIDLEEKLKIAGYKSTATSVLFPGASAQTEEMHEEEIESGLQEKEEVVEEEVVVTSSDEDEDAEDIFQE